MSRARRLVNLIRGFFFRSEAPILKENKQHPKTKKGAIEVKTGVPKMENTPSPPPVRTIKGSVIKK